MPIELNIQDHKAVMSMSERGKLGGNANRGVKRKYSDLEIEKRRQRIEAYNESVGRIGKEARKARKMEEVAMVKRYAEEGVFVPIGAREEKSRR